MILLTGATGVVGTELLPMLLEGERPVRALVREPRRLGPQRVNVQIALGDLADPFSIRHAMRGVETVIHLAASIRDQEQATIEELNGLATIHLLRAAERAGVKRFLYFSALNATDFQRTRFFRSKALAERAVQSSSLQTTVFAPSIVYDPSDPWIGLLRRMSMLPVMPVSGSGACPYQPIWARDVASCVAAALQDGGGRYELAGPEVLTYDGIVEAVLRGLGRSKPLVHVPTDLVRIGLRGAELIGGQAAFATWDEAELLEVPMTTPRGTEDAERLGVKPRHMEEILSSNGRPR
jgi:uncharacterized protein YbjT (DUF2867 family)